MTQKRSLPVSLGRLHAADLPSSGLARAAASCRRCHAGLAALQTVDGGSVLPLGDHAPGEPLARLWRPVIGSRCLMLCRPEVVALTCPATALAPDQPASSGVAPSAVPILCPAMVEPEHRGRSYASGGCSGVWRRCAGCRFFAVSISDHDGLTTAGLRPVNAWDAITLVSGSAANGLC